MLIKKTNFALDNGKMYEIYQQIIVEDGKIHTIKVKDESRDCCEKKTNVVYFWNWTRAIFTIQYKNILISFLIKIKNWPWFEIWVLIKTSTK